MARTHQTGEREDEAAAMLARTRLSRGVAPTLVVAFLATLLVVPLIQRFLPSQKPKKPVAVSAGKTPLIPDGHTLRALEKKMEDDSVVFNATRPPTQLALTKALRAGNGQVVIGVENWLFYDKEVRAITGRGFLQDSPYRKASLTTVNAPIVRDQMGDASIERHDSVPTILDFQQQLKKRGIVLIVMPIPVKATIYPEKLWPNYKQTDDLPQNVSLPRWKAVMEAHGIRVLDVTPDLLKAKARGEELFVSTDTHWTPRAAEIAAHKLSEMVTQTATLSPRVAVAYKRVAGNGRAPDDLVRVLGLPKDQTLFVRRPIKWNGVYTPRGTVLQAQQNTELLMLGDSFTGFYDGGGASLFQQLGYELKRPIDALVVPNGGSYLSRLKLVQEAARGRDHLQGKRIVILEFTARDLYSGNWKIYDLPN